MLKQNNNFDALVKEFRSGKVRFVKKMISGYIIIAFIVALLAIVFKPIIQLACFILTGHWL